MVISVFKEYTLLTLFCIACIVLVIFPSGNAPAAEFFELSEDQLTGSSTEYGINFSSKYSKDDRISIVLRVNGKQIDIVIGGKDDIYLHGYMINNNETAYLNTMEAAKIGELLIEILYEAPERSRVRSFLLSALNLLSSWPPNLPLEYISAEIDQISGYGLYPERRHGTEWTSACDWPPPIGLSESICSEMNRRHKGDYIRVAVPLNSFIFFPLVCMPVFEVVGPYPYEAGDCLGRCGKGCIGDGIPNNDVNRFTQNCFNHDICVGELYLTHPYCNQMFLYTVGDFFFGQDCRIDQARFE